MCRVDEAHRRQIVGARLTTEVDPLAARGRFHQGIGGQGAACVGKPLGAGMSEADGMAQLVSHHVLMRLAGAEGLGGPAPAVPVLGQDVGFEDRERLLPRVAGNPVAVLLRTGVADERDGQNAAGAGLEVAWDHVVRVLEEDRVDPVTSDDLGLLVRGAQATRAERGSPDRRSRHASRAPPRRFPGPGHRPAHRPGS